MLLNCKMARLGRSVYFFFKFPYILVLIFPNMCLMLCLPFICQIKKLGKHTCASTSQLEKNCMATNAWVRDRAITIMKDEPTIQAGKLRKDLQNKYNIQLSYYVV